MENISHRGKISAIEDNQITVEILSHSACGSCAARSNCALADCLPKQIKVSSPEDDVFFPGEEVEIKINAAAGLKAVFYAYLLPLLLMLGALTAAAAAGANEQISGIFGIIILIPYYFWLFLNRKKLNRQFRFVISKINTSGN